MLNTNRIKTGPSKIRLIGPAQADPQTRDSDRGKPEVYPAGEHIRKEPTVLQSLFFNLSRGSPAAFAQRQFSTAEEASTAPLEGLPESPLPAINSTNWSNR